jgi:uncharacterized GH25 family protein
MHHIKLFQVSLFLLVLFAATPEAARAHYPWLTVLTEEPLVFELGWGHEFPGDSILEAGRVESVTLSHPDGTTKSISLVEDATHLAGSLAQTGAHLLGAVQAPGYYSRTPQGGRSGSRIDHPAALTCSQSANTMKALISRGRGGEPSRLLGHALELVPLADPGTLEVGEELPLQLLFHGRPFQGTIDATWTGHPAKGKYAESTPTDGDGRARIKLAGAGLWLVKATTREPYPEPAVCDHRSFTATLTFRVR